MIRRSSFLGLLAASLLVTPVMGQEGAIDRKAIDRIVQEVALVPSLYARYQGEPNLKGLPKFTAKKLAAYTLNDAETADKEKRRWLNDKDQYDKGHPVRAAIFDAMVEMEVVEKMKLRVALLGIPITPKIKAALLQEQAPIGLATFKLEQVLVRMKEAGEKRNLEKSPRWLLNFDFARTRVESNLIFLYEYNFTLGTIRADNLPELRPADAGWRITFHPNLHITEAKVKRYAQDRAKRLQRIREEHAGTPWAYLADLEGGRLLGMMWAPAKD